MGAVPETRYAKSGDAHIAYQVVGDGPLDLVFSPSPVSNLEVGWEWPPFARFLNRLASFSRLILFDKRGTGLSDRTTDAATLEQRMDDVRAVMDAAGSDRAAIFGSSEGGPMALLFAATYPDRVSSLVLYGSYAKAINTDDYHSGVDIELFDIGQEIMAKEWGHCALIEVFSPSVAHDEDFRRWWGRYERQSASPGAAVEIQRLNSQLDVRPILPAIKVPTLVLYRAGEFVAHVEGSKYLAEHITGAVFDELSGVDYHPYVGDQDAIVDRIEEFLTGAGRVLPPGPVLATLLAIDIDPVADERVAAVVDEQVTRYEGRTGRGGHGSTTVATFDGPARAVSCALAITDALATIEVEARVGGHIGEVEWRGGDDLSGHAIAVTRAVATHAPPGGVVISRTLADVLAGTGFTLVDAGEHPRPDMTEGWHLFAVNPPPTITALDATSAVPSGRGTTGVFRPEGDVWRVGLGDAPANAVRAMKGFADIAALLARPGLEIHVAELVGGAATEMGTRPPTDPTLDATAIASYRTRLAELAAEQDDADAMHDLARAERAQVESDAILERLSADLGLGGRARTADDWVERARKAVRTRVAKALTRIEDVDTALGRHLRASIRTGTYCAYEPVTPVDWKL